jgi:hypothetical protein
MTSILHTALALAAKNIAVLPCVPGQKIPACARGLKDATTDVLQIRAWWDENPEFNLAIATGTPSGIFILDVDGDTGEGALTELERERGALPPTVAVITGKGRHLYFLMPNAPVRNSAGKIGEHLDVRGTGGYVLAPPSLHPSGKRYAWAPNSASAFAVAPSWLIDKIKGQNRTPTAEWVSLLSNSANEGTRDCTIARIAGHLLHRYVRPEVVLELLTAWNEARCNPALPGEDIQRIVASISGAEQEKRNGKSG